MPNVFANQVTVRPWFFNSLHIILPIFIDSVGFIDFGTFKASVSSLGKLKAWNTLLYLLLRILDYQLDRYDNVHAWRELSCSTLIQFESVQFSAERIRAQSSNTMVNFYFVFYFIKLFNKHIINTTVYFSILITCWIYYSNIFL